MDSFPEDFVAKILEKQVTDHWAAKFRKIVYDAIKNEPFKIKHVFGKKDFVSDSAVRLVGTEVVGRGFKASLVYATDYFVQNTGEIESLVIKL